MTSGTGVLVLGHSQIKFINFPLITTKLRQLGVGRCKIILQFLVSLIYLLNSVKGGPVVPEKKMLMDDARRQTSTNQ